MPDFQNLRDAHKCTNKKKRVGAMLLIAILDIFLLQTEPELKLFWFIKGISPDPVCRL